MFRLLNYDYCAQREIQFFSFLLVISALEIPDITGPTPPPIECPNKLCHGKADGNYNVGYHKHHFVQCVDGLATCQACWPNTLEFSQGCNQCLYSNSDDCITTNKWVPAVTFQCPDECPHRGPEYSGNVQDPHNNKQYVACWQGTTVGCVACPGGLEYNESWNACLYEGKFVTKPTESEVDDY